MTKRRRVLLLCGCVAATLVVAMVMRASAQDDNLDVLKVIAENYKGPFQKEPRRSQRTPRTLFSACSPVSAVERRQFYRRCHLISIPSLDPTAARSTCSRCSVASPSAMKSMVA